MAVKQTEHDVGRAGLSLEDIESLTAISGRYFLNTGDQDSRIWIFRPDEPSMFLRSSLQFGDEGFSVYIADHYAGLQPILLNHKAFGNELQLTFRPSALLDSNIVSYLHQYVRSGSRLGSMQGNVIHQFLRFVVHKGFDYNAFFYYIEGTAKDERDYMSNYAQEVSHSILTLHTMDTSHFLSTGQIISDPKILALYAEEFNAETIDEMAPRYARAMMGPTDPRLDGLSKLIYAALLKIGLIHKTSRRDLVGKLQELREFMQQTLRIGMGPERMLALAYFAGKFDGFIPIQKGAVVVKLLRRVRAAAWDLVLLRLPARLLALSDDDEITVGYVCTGDRALWQIARTAKLETVTKMMPKTPEGIPVWSYDPSPLELNVAPALMEKVLEMDTNWQKGRIPYYSEPSRHISLEMLDTTIAELEQQVAAFCSLE
jgi:hypothetical protein